MTRLLTFLRTMLRRLFSRRAPERAPAMAAPLPGERRCHLVTGPAATGKSTLMRARAAGEMAEPESRVLAITASEAAARELTALPAYRSGRHFAGTPRALCCMAIGAGAIPPEEDILGRALTALDRRADRLPRFTTLLIDDAQNLSPSMVRFIDRFAHPAGAVVTYFIDPGQAIFAFAGATTDTLALLRARAGHRVVRLATRRRPMGEVAATVVAADAMEAARRAAAEASRIHAREGGSVGIITRTNAEAREAAAALSSLGIHHLLLSARLIAAEGVEAPVGTEPWRRDALRLADLRPTLPDGITIATAHTARDREMDHAVVLDTAAEQSAEETRRLTTAIARARRTVTLVTLATEGTKR